ncbi:MAG TPA: metallophosphoesterase [Solirubrobacterales bacterium]|nr:metallophosphoesterase [Solirubrobacterales bacterium]
MADGKLFAVSDLHVDHPANREVVAQLQPESDRDWLVVCGDVADAPADVEWALGSLRERFAKVIWAPGNHELLTHRNDSSQLRGEGRYQYLVELCRRNDVLTPEDPHPVWNGEGGMVRIAPLFLLYDYTFGSNLAPTREEALRQAYAAGVVCVDEFLLHPDPYPSRQAWCDARVRDAERRLSIGDPALPTVLVNHFPLIAEPTRVLRHPEFAQWCGTVKTADWHRRFRAIAAVYGHLHIPRTTWHDGVRFEEVSLGYPRERRYRASWSFAPRQILPEVSHA